jgi:hypothetical protein
MVALASNEVSGRFWRQISKKWRNKSSEARGPVKCSRGPLRSEAAAGGAIRILEGASEIMRHIVARDMLRNLPRADIPISANQEWKS